MTQPVITQPSKKCVELVKEFEGFYSRAYKCPAGVWTIGWGTIMYPTGKRVQPGDICTQAQAEVYLMWELNNKAKQVGIMLSFPIPGTVGGITGAVNQNQFDACLAFTYNMGVEAFRSSTLLKKIRANANDPLIRNEFMRWVYGGDGCKDGIDNDGDGKTDEPGEKKKLPGLVRRECAQADLYFTLN